MTLRRVVVLGGLLAASFVGAACDDGGSSSGGGGGGSAGATSAGTGGSAGTNGITGKVASGAVQLLVGPVPTAELQEGELPCPIPLKTFKLGSVSAQERTSAADGKDGFAVSCAVRANGAGFDLSATIAKGYDSFGVTGRVEAGLETQGESALNIDPNLLGGNTKCTLDVDSAMEGSQLGVFPGRVWATIRCTRLEAIGISPTRVCKAEGYLVFENCEE